MYVCCLEHADMAIDEFVDEYEEAPDIYQLAEISCTEWTSPQTCDFCENMPVLLIV